MDCVEIKTKDCRGKALFSVYCYKYRTRIIQCNNIMNIYIEHYITSNTENRYKVSDKRCLYLIYLVMFKLIFLST